MVLAPVPIGGDLRGAGRRPGFETKYDASVNERAIAMPMLVPVRAQVLMGGGAEY